MVVMHSTTKYFGGHSDVWVAHWYLTKRDELYEKAAHRRHITGNILSPSALLILAWRTFTSQPGCVALQQCAEDCDIPQPASRYRKSDYPASHH